MTAGEKAHLQAELHALFSAGVEVFRGCLTDPRNTDVAWMETVAVNFHDTNSEATKAFKLTAGDDAGDVAWTTITPELGLFANHVAHISRAHMLLKDMVASHSAVPLEAQRIPTMTIMSASLSIHLQLQTATATKIALIGLGIPVPTQLLAKISKLEHDLTDKGIASGPQTDQSRLSPMPPSGSPTSPKPPSSPGRRHRRMSPRGKGAKEIGSGLLTDQPRLSPVPPSSSPMSLKPPGSPGRHRMSPRGNGAGSLAPTSRSRSPATHGPKKHRSRSPAVVRPCRANENTDVQQTTDSLLEARRERSPMLRDHAARSSGTTGTGTPTSRRQPSTMTEPPASFLGKSWSCAAASMGGSRSPSMTNLAATAQGARSANTKSSRVTRVTASGPNRPQVSPSTAPGDALGEEARSSGSADDSFSDDSDDDAQAEPQGAEPTRVKAQVVKAAARISAKELRRLEQVMRLPQHSLDRQVRLAMDLVRLMGEHSIPADLLRHDGATDNQTSHKVKMLKRLVKDMLSTVASVLLEDDQKGVPGDGKSVASVASIVAKQKLSKNRKRP